MNSKGKVFIIERGVNHIKFNNKWYPEDGT